MMGLSQQAGIDLDGLPDKIVLLSLLEPIEVSQRLLHPGIDHLLDACLDCRALLIKAVGKLFDSVD